MKSLPVHKKVEVVSVYTAKWTHQVFRCSLSVNAEGVAVCMKVRNSFPGMPGEEFKFFKACSSLKQALDFVDLLPYRFAPKKCGELGICKNNVGDL